MSKIRKARIKDLDSLAQLYSDAKEWMNEQGLHHWDDSYLIDDIRKMLEGKDVYVMEEDGKIIAAGALSPKRPGFYDDSIDELWQEPGSQKVLYLGGLVVHPKHHGQKHASKLLHLVDEFAEENGIEYLRMDANTKFSALEAIYTHHDYEVKGEKQMKSGSVLKFYEKRLKPHSHHSKDK